MSVARVDPFTAEILRSFLVSTVREKVGDMVSDRDRKRGEALAQAFMPAYELPRDETPPRLVPVRR